MPALRRQPFTLAFFARPDLGACPTTATGGDFWLSGLGFAVAYPRQLRRQPLIASAEVSRGRHVLWLTAVLVLDLYYAARLTGGKRHSRCNPHSIAVYWQGYCAIMTGEHIAHVTFFLPGNRTAWSRRQSELLVGIGD